MSADLPINEAQPGAVDGDNAPRPIPSASLDVRAAVDRALGALPADATVGAVVHGEIVNGAGEASAAIMVRLGAGWSFMGYGAISSSNWAAGAEVRFFA